MRQERRAQASHSRKASQARRAQQGFPEGTNSDYIIKVDSPEQVKRIQESYNRRINSFLGEHGRRC